MKINNDKIIASLEMDDPNHGQPFTLIIEDTGHGTGLERLTIHKSWRQDGPHGPAGETFFMLNCRSFESALQWCKFLIHESNKPPTDH